MYMVIAAILAISIFAGLSLQQQTVAFHSIQTTQIDQVEAQSAQQINTFATAAYAYTVAQSASNGTVIQASDLQSAGYLPASFAATNGFGQTLAAVVGKGYQTTPGVLAYYTSAPTNLYGLSNLPINVQRISYGIATKLAAMQENAPAFVSGVLTGASYNQMQMPFAASSNALDLTQNFSGYSNTFASVVDAVNVMPNSANIAALIGGKGSSSTTCTPGTANFIYTGSAQTWTPPSGCTTATVTLFGAGGGAGSAGSQAVGTIGLSSGQSYGVIVGGGGAIGGGSVGGGGGGLSAICLGSCSASSALLVAGGGGGGGSLSLKDDGSGGYSGPFINGISGGSGYGGGGGIARYGGYDGASGSAFGAGGAGSYGAGGYGGGGAGGRNYNGYVSGGGGGGMPGGVGGVGGTGWAGVSFAAPGVTNYSHTFGGGAPGGTSGGLGSPTAGANGSVIISYQ